MAKLTPKGNSSGSAKPRYLNVIVWLVIALFAVLIGAWTIWASRQPDRPSIWAPE